MFLWGDLEISRATWRACLQEDPQWDRSKTPLAIDALQPMVVGAKLGTVSATAKVAQDRALKNRKRKRSIFDANLCVGAATRDLLRVGVIAGEILAGAGLRRVQISGSEIEDESESSLVSRATCKNLIETKGF